MTDEASAALPDKCEIAVVGGGIVGLCTALFLAQAGRDVVLLEKGSPWGDSSGANAGTLSLQVKRTEVFELGSKSMELWAAFGDGIGIDVGFQRPGGLRVAVTEEQVAFMRQYAAEQQAVGFELEWLQGNELRALAPWLSPEVRAATFCAADGYASPLIAGPSLIAGVRRAGARLCSGMAVTEARATEGGYRLAVGRRALACEHLAIAAGGHSVRIAAGLGVRLPLWVDCNMLTVTEPAPRFLDKVITHIGGTMSLKQHANGTVLIGGGWQGRGKFSKQTREIDPLAWVQNVGLGASIAPDIEGLRVNRAWAGYEAVTMDALPALGRLPGFETAYVAAGARGGFHMGPAQGFVLSELILEGKSSLDIARFDPARFPQ